MRSSMCRQQTRAHPDQHMCILLRMADESPIGNLSEHELSHILCGCLDVRDLATMRRASVLYRDFIDAHVLKRVVLTDSEAYWDVDAAVCAMRSFLGKLGALEEVETCFNGVLTAARPDQLLSLVLTVHEADIHAVAIFRSLKRLTLVSCEQLDDISALAACVHLESITLGQVGDFEDVVAELLDVSVVCTLPALSQLSLLNCQLLTDISPIGRCSSLVALDLSYCPAVDDVSPLSGCLQLTSLNLSHCSALHDVSPLSRCLQLTYVDVSETEVGSVVALAGLTQLRTLSLEQCCDIDDVAPLASCTALTSLNIIGCLHISSAAALSSCNSILSLLMRDCCLDTIPPLSSSLQKLSFGSSEESRMPAFMSTLTQLRSLHIAAWHILSDIRSMSGLVSLTSLQMHVGSRVHDLMPLSKCTGLVEMCISSNSTSMYEIDHNVINFSHLTGLRALRELVVMNYANVMDLSPLSHCISLEKLQLVSCENLQHVAPLRACPRLTHLRLDECNNVRDADAMAGRPAWNLLSNWQYSCPER